MDPNTPRNRAAFVSGCGLLALLLFLAPTATATDAVGIMTTECGSDLTDDTDVLDYNECVRAGCDVGGPGDFFFTQVGFYTGCVVG